MATVEFRPCLSCAAWIFLVFAIAMPASASSPGRPSSWRIEGVESSVVTEIKGETGNSVVSRKAEKGSIVQVRAIFSPPLGLRKLTLSQIKLSGSSSDLGAKSSWVFEPIGIALATPGSCNYLFPDSIVKGEISQTLKDGGELSLKREKKGDELTLSVGPSTPLCLAFPIPATPQGRMKLLFGGSEAVVPAAPPK